MLVHHTTGLRQQLGKAKLHRDLGCRFLRGSVGVYSEDIDEGSMSPGQRCRNCNSEKSKQTHDEGTDT